MRVETFTFGELQENGYLVVEDAGTAAASVDPGDEPGRLIERVERSGLVLGAILLTHAHWDHVGGVRQVKQAFGAPIYLHPADRPLYEHVAEQAEFFGFHADPQPPADREVWDSDVVEVGALRFEVLHVPGHTPGGVCYKIEGAVFVGDAVFAGSVGRTDLPGGSHRQLIEGIRQKLLSLDDGITLYPGHGPPTTVGQERRANPFLM